jgi:D-3-phosphoglycerate dehydrogenase
MPHILVPDVIHEDGIAILRDAPGVTLDWAGAPRPGTLAERLAEADAVIVRGTPIGQKELDAAPRLRFVCRHGVGYDSIDVPALTRRGVLLGVTPDANADSVAEHAMMLMLALARQLVHFNASVRRGEWRVRGASPTFDVGGRTVLVVGFGRIGGRVARLCAAFRLKVLVHDPYVPANTIRGAGHVPVRDLREGLAAADIVTLHCPSNDRTRNMVDAGFLAAMKPGAVLVNTARGTLVEEAALEAALRSGHLAGAALDVLHTEPMTEPVPLLALPNLLLTPHVAASTAEGLQRMAVSAAQNALAFLAGTLDVDSMINPEVLRTNG